MKSKSFFSVSVCAFLGSGSLSGSDFLFHYKVEQTYRGGALDRDESAGEYADVMPAGYGERNGNALLKVKARLRKSYGGYGTEPAAEILLNFFHRFSVPLL